MEKYRKFADAKYGINPFVPQRSKSPKALKYTFGLILLLFRLPFVIFLLGSLYLYNLIFKKFIVVKSLRNAIEQGLYKLLALTFGLFEFKVLPKYGAKDPNRPRFEPGYVVLTNHTHPLGFLFFSQICSPTFVKLFTKSTGAAAEKEVLLSPLGFSSVLKYFFGRGFNFPQDAATNESDSSVKLAELASSNFKNKEGPIVIFFEGATTNGKGVLEMPEGLAYDLYEYQKQENRETVVATVIFNENEEASVAHPIVASLSFLMNWSNPAIVRLCPIAKMPVQRKDMPKTIYDMYENILTIPKMALRSEDYQAFLEYWRSTQGKTYIKGSKDL